MNTIPKTSKINIVHATAKHNASLFFFHGSGTFIAPYTHRKYRIISNIPLVTFPVINKNDLEIASHCSILGSTGLNAKEWIDILNKGEFSFPHIKIIYPTAPAQPYTPNNGMLSHVWFNRKSVSNDAHEEVESINSICKGTMEYIDEEVSKGIQYDRIVLAGFSMGGALALYLSYRNNLPFAGCCAMSSFLNKNSVVYQYLKENPGINKPPLLQFHGTADKLVPIEWGEDCCRHLKELGVNTQFIPLNNVDHVLSKFEIDAFKKWILDVLPEK